MAAITSHLGGETKASSSPSAGSSSPSMPQQAEAAAAVENPQLQLPRVTIKFCTQCKWMLRAAYYAQELLSTFSTSLGEVALQPAAGGVFVVQIHHIPSMPSAPSAPGAEAPVLVPPVQTSTHTLWDRKTDGGFPETKELKRRLRDVIEPGRNLGHVDRNYPPRPSLEHAPSSTPVQAPAHPTAVGDGDRTTVVQQGSIHHPAELMLSTRPQPTAEATTSPAEDQLDLAHRSAIATVTGDTGPGPTCEDCQ